MPTLPAYRGRYKVGISTFAAAVPRTVFGGAHLPNDGGPALILEEVAFNVYYPADVTKEPPPGVPWLPMSLSAMLTGYAKFTGIKKWLLWPFVYLFGSYLKIPAYPNAPLLPPPETNSKSDDSSETLANRANNARWPLVLFSHGLAGTRTTYSQWCGNLASEGHVVLALEHRDGSGPIVFVRSETEGRTIERVYVPYGDVTWPNDDKPKPSSKYPFRGEELPFRAVEVYEAHRVLANMVQGKRGNLNTIDGSNIDWRTWTGKVNCDENVLLAGHSFGGATALTILASPPPSDYKHLPISRVFLMDPWMDSLSIPGPAPDATLPRPDIFVIQSEGFTVWDEQYTRLEEIMQDFHKNDQKADLVTIVRSKHNDFSDFPLFVPFKYKKSTFLAEKTFQLTMAFIRGTLHELLQKEGRTNMVIEKQWKQKKRIVGKFGEIIVHE